MYRVDGITLSENRIPRITTHWTKFGARKVADYLVQVEVDYIIRHKEGQLFTRFEVVNEKTGEVIYKRDLVIYRMET